MCRISLRALRYAVLLAAALTHASVASAVPDLISYQGVLSDSGGQPVSATVSMTFRIYDSETGGTELWGETQSVQVSNGVFNVQLGSVQALASSVFFTDTLYLGTQVDADPEMSPRQQLVSGPFSKKSDLVGHAGLPIGTIMSWAKTLAGVPPLSGSWVECNGQVLNDAASPLDGQTIPNLNGENRFLRGSAASGATGGEESHALTIDEMPNHGHLVNHSYFNSSNGSTIAGVNGGAGYYTSTLGTGGSLPHENRPPFYDVVYIIKTK